MPAIAALPEWQFIRLGLSMAAYRPRTNVTAIQVGDEESNNHHRRKPTVEFPEKLRFSRRVYHDAGARISGAGRIDIAILCVHRRLFHGHCCQSGP